ncbi:hypothetical protein PCE1_002121 [Barthelona sp. PCE]
MDYSDAIMHLDITGVTDFTPIVEQLAEVEDLRYLHLYGESLKTLGADLSDLKNIEVLDLDKNVFPDIECVLPALKSLDGLKHLFINFENDSDELKVAESLSHLSSLNGFSFDNTDVPLQGCELLTKDFKTDLSLNISQQSGTEVDLTQISFDQIDVESLRNCFHSLCPSFEHAGEMKEAFDELIDGIKPELAEQKYGRTELKQLCELVNETAVLGQEPLQHLAKFAISAIYNLGTHQQSSEADAKRISALEKENEEILVLAKELEKESTAFNEERQNISETFHKERMKLVERVSLLEQENVKLKARVTGVDHIPNTLPRMLTSSYASPKKVPVYSPHADNTASPKRSPRKGRTRVLSLKQLKEVIVEIYAAKEKFDAKCIREKSSMETLQQFLFTFLGQKYGLKSLIVEWLHGIKDGVSKFAAYDNDVAVFSRILSNQIEENFRFVQMQLKSTVITMLEAMIKTESPFLSAPQLKKAVEEKKAGSLSEDEWSSVMGYLFDNDDAMSINLRIQEFIKKLPSEHNNDDLLGEVEIKPKLRFVDFLKILLDYQLKSHIKFLSTFVTVYRVHDMDHDGVLSRQQLASLISNIRGPTPRKMIKAICDEHDAGKHDKITFCQCVDIFADDIVDIELEGMSLGMATYDEPLMSPVTSHMQGALLSREIPTSPKNSTPNNTVSRFADLNALSFSDL